MLSRVLCHVAAAARGRLGAGIAHVVVDVIVPDGEVLAELDAVFVEGNLVVFDRPVIGHPVEGLDPTLGHLADDEIPDGHVVDVFVVRPERGLRVIGRRPAGAVEDRAVFADKDVARLRPD